MTIPHEIPGAVDLLTDQVFNPGGFVLRADDVEQLQLRIDDLNANVATWRTSIRAIMSEWAKARRDAGLFVEVGPEEEVYARMGAVLIRTLDENMVTKDVWIYPGECAQLDLALLEANGRFETHLNEIREFVATTSR